MLTHPFAEIATFPIGQGALIEPFLQWLEWRHVDGQMVHRFTHGHGGAPNGG